MRFAPTIDAKRSVIRILSTTPANSYSYVTETEDLILDLKFATGLKKDDTVTPLTENHKFNNTEFGKKFCVSYISSHSQKTDETTLPRKYIWSLKTYSRSKT